MFLAKVHIMPKPSILDPQGQAVAQALHKLGHKELKELRVGRYIELRLDMKEKAQAEKKVKDYCETLLANTVIESYDFELESLPA